MSLEQRLELVKRKTVEIIQRSELERLLGEKEHPRAYWGFECSGTQACPARNDAHRPRSRMCLQDSRPNQGRVPLHSLPGRLALDRKSTRLNSSHANISYAVFCLKKKNTK